MNQMQPNIAKALGLFQQALDELKRGLLPEEPEAKTAAVCPASEQVKIADIMKAAPITEPAATVEAEPVSLDEIRKVFAKILLDDKVNGREMIRDELQSHQANKLSEVNPDAYFSVITNVVSKYASNLKKADPAHFDAKIEEMKTWSIPF